MFPQPAPLERPSRPRGLCLGRYRGVPVLLAPSWWFGAAVIVLLYLPAIVALVPGVRAPTALLLGVVFAVLLAVSVLLHELGHCVVAVRLGMPVARIRLFLLGGVTEITRPPGRPRDEGLVAVAGPVVSVLLTAAGGLGWWAATPGTAVWMIAAQVTVANAVVAVFNLLPGLPLDGGRALRAVVWAVSGRREVGTLAGVLGAGLVAVALLWWAVSGWSAGDGGGWPRLVVAVAMVVFIGLGARSEVVAERSRRVPPGMTLAGLARPVLEIPAETPLSDAVAVAAGHGVVLVSPDGTAVGLLDGRLAGRVLGRDPRAGAFHAAEPISPEAVLLVSEELSDVVHRVRETPAWQYLVVDLDGRPVGVLRRDDLHSALRR